MLVKGTLTMTKDKDKDKDMNILLKRGTFGT